MTIEREADARVVVDDLATFGCLRQCQRRFGDRRIAQQLGYRVLRGHLPPRFAPMARDADQRVRRGQRFEIAPRQCRATRQIVDVGKLRVAASRHDAFGRYLRKTFDQMHADAYCRTACTIGFRRLKYAGGQLFCRTPDRPGQCEAPQRQSRNCCADNAPC